MNPIASGLAPVATGIASILDPAISGILPVETGILSPAGSALSGVIGGATSVLFPIATPLLSGILSAATQAALPIVTPVICDVVASDIEHGLLGLNAGCVRGQLSATNKSPSASAGSASARGRNATSLMSTNSSITIRPSTLRTASASVVPCVVTVLVQEYQTLYEDEYGRHTTSPSSTAVETTF